VKIHIVYSDLDSDRILARLARALAAETGWKLGPTPMGRVDLNYFICYIDYGERFSDWHDTKTAAWFTHFEEGTPYKEFWWNLAADHVDLRLTSARQYAEMLEPLGPTALVRPALNRQAFTIEPVPGNERPLVGLSGFVDRSGRKGEKLVAQLARSELGGKIELVASGRGWPAHTTERTSSDLPLFYQGLDVYLCTSLVEGVPIPPLEALACGVPVVVPRGVGLLDSLPDIEGVYRYGAGDFKGMCQALEKALAARPDREALRAITEPYTAENWAGDHFRAFEGLLHDGSKIRLESDQHGLHGVLYVAYGDPARDCARASILSFKKHMPNTKVALISTEALGPEDHFIECPDMDIGGRAAKTMIYDLAPSNWQYVMYLDADTEVIAPIRFLYDVLRDDWDMVICKNPAKYHTTKKMIRSDNKDECEHTFSQIGTDELLQLNGGVFAFQRNFRTAAFFRAWHEEWKRWGKRDQAALLRALFANPLKLYVLGNEWNTITRYDPKESSAGILHYPMTARRWRGKVTARSDSKEAWQAVRKWEAQEGQK
jgi:hypothetical protein